MCQHKVYHVYDNYAEKLVTVRQVLTVTCPNLHLVGRSSMHRYNNQDHATAIALNIIAGK